MLQCVYSAYFGARKVMFLQLARFILGGVFFLILGIRFDAVYRANRI